MSDWSIYALVDPRNDEIRYVGKAADPVKRLGQHLRAYGRTKKARWIQSLAQQGLQPKLVILETGSGEWADTEIAWIARFSNLTNLTTGGEGLRITPEVREAIKVKLQGRKLSAEHVANLPQNQKGYRWSEAERERRRRDLLTHAHPAAIATSLSPADLIHLADLAKQNRGNKYCVGRVMPEHEKTQRSLAQKGRPKTPEHKRKLKQAALNRWARARGEMK